MRIESLLTITDVEQLEDPVDRVPPKVNEFHMQWRITASNATTEVTLHVLADQAPAQVNDQINASFDL